MWPFAKSVPAPDIIAAMEPWTLCCAVGAKNGTIGSAIGFDMWLHLSRKNWMPKIVAKTGATERAIESALTAFVEANQDKSYRIVFDELNGERGLKRAAAG